MPWSWGPCPRVTLRDNMQLMAATNFLKITSVSDGLAVFVVTTFVVTTCQ